MTQSRDPAVSQAGLAHLRAVVDGNLQSHDQLTNLASKTASRRLLVVLQEIARQRRAFVDQLREVINGAVVQPIAGQHEAALDISQVTVEDQLFAGETAFDVLAKLESIEKQLLDSYAAAMEEIRQQAACDLLADHCRQVAQALALFRGIRHRFS